MKLLKSWAFNTVQKRIITTYIASLYLADKVNYFLIPFH